ncbi:MAG: Helicase associated domain protein [Gammaproteobacteria bacterium]|nr:Helicase associated domain protein [Gammaproteobacteria bacterium]
MDVITSSNSWQEFENKLSKLSKKEKGDAFEELTRLYFLTDPLYISRFDKVWHHSRIPQDVKDTLDLPQTEIGIDLVCKTKKGEYWAVQCKFHQDTSVNLNIKELSTFFSETEKRIADNKFSYRMAVSSAEEIGNKLKNRKSKKIGYLLYDIWSSLEKEQFDAFRKILNNEKIDIKCAVPRKHQKYAIANCISYFKNKDNTRGKLIHPCGSGKSLTGYWCAQSLKAKTIIICVPSIALVRQTLETWVREAIGNNIKVDWIAVCSDEEVSLKDEPAMQEEDLDIEVTTDPVVITEFFNKSNAELKILITTYQSGKVVSAGVKKAKVEFDLGIYDEAHKTVGHKDKLFAYLLYDNNVPVHRRIFMTATEKQYRGDSGDVLSMDDESLYGNIIDQLSFKAALEQDPPILCDYKIVTTIILQSEIDNLVRKNKGVKPDGKEWQNGSDASTFASLIVLRKLIKEAGIKHAVSFHRSIKRAKEFEQLNMDVEQVDKSLEELKTFHVSGKDGSGKRTATLERYKNSNVGLITNARCLTEGVDVPTIDAVLFADPKQSKIDIVQAAGRALRVYDSKKYGYIIVPIVINENDASSSDKAFDQIVSVVCALGANDERIIEEFKDISQGSSGGGGIFTIQNVPEIIKIKYKDFESNINLKILSRLDGGFSIGFQHLQEYFEREGHSNVPMIYEVDGYKLGSWVSMRRKNFRNNKLSKDRIEKLKTVDFIFDDLFYKGFRYLKKYFEREGHSNVPQKYEVDGYKLGNWLIGVRRNFKKNKLEKEKIDKLKSVNFIFDILQEKFNEGFRYLKKYFEREGHSNVPMKYEVDGFKLGQWVGNCRERFRYNKLSKDRIDKLKLVNFIFDMYQEKFNEGFRYLKKYFEREGHSNVPRKYEVDGFNLGQWVGNCRERFKYNKLSKDQIDKLKSVNFIFDMLQEKFNEGFRYLKKYFEREGHSNVPMKYEVDGFNLGRWVGTCRNRFKNNKLSKDRIEKLKTVDFIFKSR